MLEGKRTLLLDMNSTFMFGEDNFGPEQDFSIHYLGLGGSLPDQEVNLLIRRCYDYLAERYPQPNYRHSFPSLQQAFEAVASNSLDREELDLLIQTFAHHEHGYIPPDYVEVLKNLKQRYTLALVIDIWAPKNLWLETFKRLDLWLLFSAASFSSDHGMVKPSEKPFELVVETLGEDKKHCVVIGDSVRRDLGGALAAGIDCILVGDGHSDQALACYDNLLVLAEQAL